MYTHAKVMPMKVTIIGDAFVDIVVPVAGASPGETYHRDIGVACGGTANVAVQISRLGKEARFVGRVGNDALGLFFVENLKRHNVEALISFDERHPTGVCVSLVREDGERTMIAMRGANDYLTRNELDVKLGDILKSEVVYFSGYSLLNNLKVTLDLMAKCRGSCEVWFNPGAPNIITDSFSSVVKDLVDVLVLNLDEAKAMTGKDEIEEIMTELGAMAELSVVSLGKDGGIVCRGGEWTRVAAGEVISDVDTTGAGDAFSAGLIAGKLEGMDDIECARLANQVAANFLREKGR